MARFFVCRPVTEANGEESVFAINLDRVQTIIFARNSKGCKTAKLEFAKEVQILHDIDADELYSLLKD